MELRSWVRKHLAKMEASGIIEKHNGSPFNSPMVLVKKSNGKWRTVSDFRMLNEKLEDNHFPLPHIKDLLDELHGSTHFSSIDLRSGFFNIALTEASKPCTAFSVEGQTYVYSRLPQGIKISPAVFQRIMARVAGDMLRKSARVYMDDLLLYDRNSEDALRSIDQILTRFGDAGFKLNPEKCLFGVETISYLGYDISAKGWKPRVDKVKAIKDFAKPTSVTEIRSFVGMANFYSSAIPKLQLDLKPLHQLTGKKTYSWNDEAQHAFENIKKKLEDTSLLSFYSRNENDTLYLTSDSSNSGWGCVLSQYQSKKNAEVPLGYASGSYNTTQTKWPIREQELFAFVSGLRNFDTYLFGRPFVWRTDNKS